jgi:DNA-binding transcriptional ArsR family regulator
VTDLLDGPPQRKAVGEAQARLPCAPTGPAVTYNLMVVDIQNLEDTQNVEDIRDGRTDQVFHALADATRRDIVRRAMHGEHSVSALARNYPMSFAAVQKHVAVLERAELVRKRRHGREQLVRTDIETIRTTYRLFEEFEAMWRARMDRFDEVLTRSRQGETT